MENGLFSRMHLTIVPRQYPTSFLWHGWSTYPPFNKALFGSRDVFRNEVVEKVVVVKCCEGDMIFHTIRVIKSSMNHERTSLLHHRIRKIYKTEINIGMLPIPVTLGSESNVNILVVTGMVVCKQRNINIYLYLFL